MADKKISELTALLGANTAGTDVLPIVDTSALTTKKISMTDLSIGLKNAVTVDTVAEIEALTPADTSGSVILTHATRGGVFTWDSSNRSSEVTADTQQGIWIAPSSDATGASGAWKRQYDGAVSVKWFGAVGDGVADDTAAIQAALGIGGKLIYLPSGSYKLSTTIKIPSETTIIGDGQDKTIFSSTYDGPILASENYFASSGVSPTGDVLLKEFSVSGDSTGSNQIGILLRDYYSTIDSVNIYNTLGNAIEITHINDAAVAASGSLVNNRLIHIRTYGTGPVYLGADDNGKITDGVIDDAIISVHASSDYALYIGGSAGWFIDKIHTEGNTPTENSVYISNAYHTSVGSIYCESAGVSAKPVVNVAKIQKNISISSLSITISTSTAIGLSLGKSGSVANAQSSISNLYIRNTHASNSVTGISIQTSTIQLKVGTKTYDTESGGAITDSYLSTMLSRHDSVVTTGTWTPTIYGASTAGTYTLASLKANYVRVGNHVTVMANFSFSAASGGSGILFIAGLPYSYSANTPAMGDITGANFDLNTTTPANVSLLRATTSADNRLVVSELVDNAAATLVQVNNISTSTTITLQFSYFTDEDY